MQSVGHRGPHYAAFRRFRAELERLERRAGCCQDPDRARMQGRLPPQRPADPGRPVRHPREDRNLLRDICTQDGRHYRNRWVPCAKNIVNMSLES